MTLPKPVAVQTFDTQDQFGNSYNDWANPRPLLYFARFAWSLDSDGFPQHKQVDNTLGSWGGHVYMKPGGTSRKLGQWGTGGVVCKVTQISPTFKVQPVKDTGFNKDSDLSDFTVTAVTGYSPSVDDLVSVYQLSDQSAEQLVAAPLKASSGTPGGLQYFDFTYTFTGSEGIRAGDGYRVDMGVVPITGEFCYDVGGYAEIKADITSSDIHPLLYFDVIMDYEAGLGALQIVADGQGDNAFTQQSGTTRGSHAQFGGRGSSVLTFNYNGYFRGVPNSSMTNNNQHPTHLWFGLYTASTTPRPTGGTIKARVWYSQTVYSTPSGF